MGSLFSLQYPHLEVFTGFKSGLSGSNPVFDSSIEDRQVPWNRRSSGCLKSGRLEVCGERSEIAFHNLGVAGSSPAPALGSAFIGRFFHITTADLGLEPITLDRWFESSVSGRQNAVSEQDLDKFIRICISVMGIIKTNQSELQV